MARRSSFSIKFDVEPLTQLADRLALLTPEQSGRLVVEAINETVDSAYELSRKAILGGINLTDAYVQRKMQVEHATEQQPVASIVAFGGRAHLTNLSHYGAIQERRSVNWTNERITSMGKKFGPWPGWTRRTGDEKRGIEVNKKTDGISVEVVRGSRRLMRRGDNTSTAFIVPGKRDADGNPLVMKRTASGKAAAFTGPSVYQLFKVAAEQIQGQVTDDLQESVIAVAERKFLEALR